LVAETSLGLLAARVSPVEPGLRDERPFADGQFE
jgi:hypothetical protein